MKRNQFLTCRGFLTRDGHQLCWLAAQPGCNRAKLAAEYRCRGYDDFSINCVFREADDRSRLIQKSNRKRGRGTAPAADPPVIVCDGGPIAPADSPPSARDTVAPASTVHAPTPPTDRTMDRGRRETLYLAAGEFLARIADDPGNPAHRLDFAAWLDANGLRREATGQRWAARHGKRPAAGDGDYEYECGGWYAEHDRADASATLPDCLHRIAGAPANSQPICYEMYFLSACGEVEWGEDGEPIGS
jgi:hypothetical protein